MYTAHFGLNAAPFSITPDPHYLYLSGRHREALAHLLYGVNEGPGFVLLTGEVGTGKTTLCRSLIEQLPENVDVALLLNPRLSPLELLAALFDELRISYDHQSYTLKDYIDTLHSYLLTAHAVERRTVLILDEAQNLSTEVLEQVRLLTNLETASHKLLQIILVGQPELKNLLKRRNLRQLSQRITARYHLLPLSSKDTKAYINHRLAISGAKSPLFTDAAMRLVYRYSGGVPRLINIICDRALLGGYVNNENPIDTHIVRKAVQEVRGENVSHSSPVSWIIGLLTVSFLIGVSIWWWNSSPSSLFQPQPISSEETSSLSPRAPVTTDHESMPPVAAAAVAVEEKETLPPPPPSLSTLLQAGAATDTYTESAFVTLFRLWGLDYTNLKGEKACQRAATKGLACLLRTATWEELRRFNRPAVIELMTDEGVQHYVVVTRWQDDTTVTLAIGDQSLAFSLEEINEFWMGQFLLLWQPPMLPVPVIKVGITNEAVIWVRKHLDLIEGLRSEPHALSARFDQTLRRRVVEFQRQQQLEPDGVVGEQTMLALQALVAGQPGQGPSLIK